MERENNYENLEMMEAAPQPKGKHKRLHRTLDSRWPFLGFVVSASALWAAIACSTDHVPRAQPCAGWTAPRAVGEGTRSVLPSHSLPCQSPTGEGHREERWESLHSIPTYCWAEQWHGLAIKAIQAPRPQPTATISLSQEEIAWVKSSQPPFLWTSSLSSTPFHSDTSFPYPLPLPCRSTCFYPGAGVGRC